MDFRTLLTREEQAFLEENTQHLPSLPFLSGYKTGFFRSELLDISIELLPNQYYANIDLPLQNISGDDIGLPSKFIANISDKGFIRYDLIRSDVQDDLGKLIFDTFFEILFLIRTGHSQEFHNILQDSLPSLKIEALKDIYHLSDVMHIQEIYSIFLFSDQIKKDFKMCSGCFYQDQKIYDPLINCALPYALSKKGYTLSDLFCRFKEPPFFQHSY